MNQCLSKFYLAARKQDGSHYDKTSLLSIRVALDCYLHSPPLNESLLEQPAYKLKSYGSRAFSVCAPGLWNKLPLKIRSSTSVPEFKRRLKTHLFRQAFFYNS